MNTNYIQLTKVMNLGGFRYSMCYRHGDVWSIKKLPNDYTERVNTLSALVSQNTNGNPSKIEIKTANQKDLEAGVRPISKKELRNILNSLQLKHPQHSFSFK